MYFEGYEDEWVKILSTREIERWEGHRPTGVYDLLFLYICKTCNTEHETIGNLKTSRWHCAKQNTKTERDRRPPKPPKLPKVRPPKQSKEITNYKQIYSRVCKQYQLCERWNEFNNFYTDTVASRPKDTHEAILPVDTNTDFGPDNFRWGFVASLTADELQCRVDLRFAEGFRYLYSKESKHYITCPQGHIFYRKNKGLLATGKGHCAQCESIKRQERLQLKESLHQRRLMDVGVTIDKALLENTGGKVKRSSEYVDNSTEMACHCEICHKDFSALPEKLKKSPTPCPICKQKPFYDKVSEKFDGRISILEYSGYRYPAKFSCECGNIFKLKLAETILDRIHGCSKCAKATLDYDAPTKLYYVRIKHKDSYVYKIGISQLENTKKRFLKECSMRRLKVIKEQWYNTGWEAYNREHEIMAEYKQFLVPADDRVLRDTKNTEIFTCDVLGLDE